MVNHGLDPLFATILCNVSIPTSSLPRGEITCVVRKCDISSTIRHAKANTNEKEARKHANLNGDANDDVEEGEDGEERAFRWREEEEEDWSDCDGTPASRFDNLLRMMIHRMLLWMFLHQIPNVPNDPIPEERHEDR